MTNMDPNAGNVSGAPVPQNASGAPAVAGSAIDDATIQKLVEALGPEIDKRVQSTKDKRIAQIQGDMSDFEQRLARLDALQGDGFSKEQALHMLRLEDQVAQRAPQTPQVTPPQDPGTVPGQSNQMVDNDILNALGMEANDPRVTQALQSGGDQKAVLTNLILASKGTPVPNNAQIPPMMGGQGAGGQMNADQITQRLQQLQVNPTQNMAEITQLRNQLQGLLPNG